MIGVIKNLHFRVSTRHSVMFIVQSATGSASMKHLVSLGLHQVQPDRRIQAEEVTAALDDFQEQVTGTVAGHRYSEGSGLQLAQHFEVECQRLGA